MKSKVLLTSAAALLVVSGANATQYTPFVGATMGLQGFSYSTEYKNIAINSDLDLPEDFFTFGLETGVRFGEYNKIYNGGISLNIDMTTSSDIEDKFTNVKFADLSTFNMSATYDNYLRISGDKAKRIDLVLGAGLGFMNYNIDYVDTTVNDETVYSPELAFKIGLDFQLAQHWTLSAMTRLFIPTRSHYAPESNYIVGGAIKYMF